MMALGTLSVGGKRVWSAFTKISSTLHKSGTGINMNAVLPLSTLSPFSLHRNEVLCKPNTPAGLCDQFRDSRISSLGLGQRSSLLINKISPLTVVTPVRHYQAVLRPRLHCKGCYFVWRHGRKFVECSDVPSHKQMKKLGTRKVWLEDYTRGKVNRAMKWNRDLRWIADRHVDRTVVSHNWLASRIGKDI